MKDIKSVQKMKDIKSVQKWKNATIGYLFGYNLQTKQLEDLNRYIDQCLKDFNHCDLSKTEKSLQNLLETLDLHFPEDKRAVISNFYLEFYLQNELVFRLSFKYSISDFIPSHLLKTLLE